jgi:Zn finger protein HypA/HybF involved in hydrogenase expression
VRIDPRVGLPIAAVLLGLAAWRIASYVRHKPAAEQVPARCPTCEHEFVPEPGEASPACPECGVQASIRLLYFKCEDCGEAFVAYEFKPAEGLIREPDGEWISSLECAFQRPCPTCQSDKTYFVIRPDAPAKGTAASG